MKKKHLASDKALGIISDSLPLGAVNPVNIEGIKRKFKVKPFNPEFKYDININTEILREKLAGIKCGRKLIGSLLAKEKNALFNKIALIESIGSADLARQSERVYGKPGKRLVKRADELVSIKCDDKSPKIRYEQVKELLNNTFKRLGFKYRILRNKHMVASASVQQHNKRLMLKKKERFTRQFALVLCVHEITTHALRSENGREQELTMFSRGTPGYLSTEEGLAAYNEERTGVMSASRLKNYAGRVIACKIAYNNDFVTTYKELRNWFDHKQAFKLTLRVKRGLGSGDETGAYTKDHVYLKGYFQVKDFVSRNGSLAMLHSAKISIDDISLLNKILKEPKYSPEPVIEWIRHMQIAHKR